MVKLIRRTKRTVLGQALCQRRDCPRWRPRPGGQAGPAAAAAPGSRRRAPRRNRIAAIPHSASGCPGAPPIRVSAISATPARPSIEANIAALDPLAEQHRGEVERNRWATNDNASASASRSRAMPQKKLSPARSRIPSRCSALNAPTASAAPFIIASISQQGDRRQRHGEGQHGVVARQRHPCVRGNFRGKLTLQSGDRFDSRRRND